MEKTFKAVIWDFGGVFTSSPFDAFTRYEEEKGLPKDFIRSVNAVNPLENAWALLERSEVDAAGFDGLFRAESQALGHEGKVGCITNNAPIGKGASMTNDSEKAADLEKVFARFDHVIESSKLGIRKPDPRIYALMCEALDVAPEECVYLDDLGINLKPARQMGMTTIKVLGEDQLLSDLQAVTGYALA